MTVQTLHLERFTQYRILNVQVVSRRRHLLASAQLAWNLERGGTKKSSHFRYQIPCFHGGNAKNASWVESSRVVSSWYHAVEKRRNRSVVQFSSIYLLFVLCFSSIYLFMLCLSSSYLFMFRVFVTYIYSCCVLVIYIYSCCVLVIYIFFSRFSRFQSLVRAGITPPPFLLLAAPPSRGQEGSLCPEKTNRF